MLIIRATLFLSAILYISIVPVAFATETTYTFYPVGDSFLKGGDHPDENEGLTTHMRIQHPRG